MSKNKFDYLNENDPETRDTVIEYKIGRLLGEIISYELFIATWLIAAATFVFFFLCEEGFPKWLSVSGTVVAFVCIVFSARGILINRHDIKTLRGMLKK